MDRLAATARHPQGWVRLLQRLGHDIARRHREVLALPAGKGCLDHHAGDHIERLGPLLALGRPLDVEPLQLGGRGGLARSRTPTRPSETRSRVATRSATRAEWLNPWGSWTIPWPSRILLVRWLAAPKKTSGALEWEYSSRKWCSTSHMKSIPSRSASSICSRASVSSCARRPRPTDGAVGARRRCRTSPALHGDQPSGGGASRAPASGDWRDTPLVTALRNWDCASPGMLEVLPGRHDCSSPASRSPSPGRRRRPRGPRRRRGPLP